MSNEQIVPSEADVARAIEQACEWLFTQLQIIQHDQMFVADTREAITTAVNRAVDAIRAERDAEVERLKADKDALTAIFDQERKRWAEQAEAAFQSDRQLRSKLTEAQEIRSHVEDQRAMAYALIGKIQAIVHEAEGDPNERFSDWDVLDQGVRRILKRAQATESQLATIEQALRYELWSKHGHSGKYGDDGEMQCAQCLPFGIGDFKRDPIERILEAMPKIDMAIAGERLNAEMEQAAQLAEMRAVLEAARAINEAFVSVEKSYGNSLWTTGAGWLLKKPVEAFREALAKIDAAKERDEVVKGKTEYVVDILDALKKSLDLAKGPAMERG